MNTYTQPNFRLPGYLSGYPPFNSSLLLRPVPLLQKSDRFLDSIKAYVMARLGDSFTIECLACDLFMSRVQLFRKIKKRTGQSPSEYIRMIRLQVAAELLRSTDLPIAQVAFHLGYSDPKYFCRVFKMGYRNSPKDYRKFYVKK